MYYRPHSPNCSCSTVAARAFCSALVDDDGYFITCRRRGNEHYQYDAAGDITVPSSSGPQMIVEEEYGGDIVTARAFRSALVNDGGHFNTRCHRDNHYQHYDAAGHIAVPSFSGPQMIVEEEYGGDIVAARAFYSAFVNDGGHFNTRRRRGNNYHHHAALRHCYFFFLGSWDDC